MIDDENTYSELELPVVEQDTPAAEPAELPRMTVKESIDDAVTKSREQEPRPKGRAKLKAGAEPAAATPSSDTTGEAQTSQAQKPAGPPNSWRPDEKALWPNLNPAAQKAILRIEADAAKGVESLRTQYREVDSAIAPYRDIIKKFGITDAQAVDYAFKWHYVLAGPQKVQAFRNLMQVHGVDPAIVAGAQPQQQNAYPNQSVDPQVANALGHIMQRLNSYDQQVAAQGISAAQTTLNNWSKDKPHYEAVRQKMAQLIGTGVVPPLQDGNPDLDGAYQTACRMDPEIFADMQRQEVAQRQKAQKEAAQKARFAGSSLRPAAPTASVGTAKGNSAARTETARESILRALAEGRSA